jgi:hypothetical protein
MTRYPDAEWFPGPAGKQGYAGHVNQNAMAGMVLHSMDGFWATGGTNILLNGSTSWHFSILRSGKVLQHYELEAQTYHCGIASQNRRLIGIEHEAVHGFTHSTNNITEAQIAASVKLCQWIAAIPIAYALKRGETLFLHKDLGTSECPGTLFDGILERWTGAPFTPAPEAALADIRSVDVGLIRLSLEAAGRALRDAHKIAGGDGDLIRGQ